jgi:UDP-glucose 4-epimerase
VVDALLTRGDEVHVVDDLSKGQVTNIPPGVPLHVVDIATGPVAAVLGGTTFDAVVHCAAQTNVMRSIADPELDRRINIGGLERILEAAKHGGARKFVFISSGGAVYGETPSPADEDAEPHPGNPYGRHKLEGEGIVAAAPIASVTLRLSNVYGPRQRSDAEGGVVSIFADRLAAGLRLQVYGDGEQQRDFVHVSDVVAAIELALDDAGMMGVWNVGSGTPTTVNDVARLMTEAFGAPAGVEHLPARGEIRRSCADVGKLRAAGWSPSRDLRAGIEELAAALVTRA